MVYSHEVEKMCQVKVGASHGCAPIPEEGKWVYSREIKDISGLTHGVGWCAPQQGACKLTLNVKDGIIQEALIETLGCSGMTHSAAMASEAIVGKTLLEAVNTDLVCDAINTAMRELFLQIIYGRTQSAFSRTVCRSALVWKIWVRVCALRLVLPTALWLKVLATWLWLKVTSPAWVWTLMIRSSVTSSLTWAA